LGALLMIRRDRIVAIGTGDILSMSLRDDAT
jgi:hypothetical protein